MTSPLQHLTKHLLSTTFVWFVVAVALGALWSLSGWLAPTAAPTMLLRSAVLVSTGVAIVMYVFYFRELVKSFQRGQMPRQDAPISGPPSRQDVTFEHSKGVTVTCSAFLLLFGLGLVVGLPARGDGTDEWTYQVFRGLERAILFLVATALVFGLTLQTTHSFRGVLRSYNWKAYNDRPAEGRNLPLDVALAAIVLFVVAIIR